MIKSTFLLGPHFLDNEGKLNKEFAYFPGEGTDSSPLGIFLAIIRKGDELLALGKGSVCSSIPHFHEISLKRDYSTQNQF